MGISIKWKIALIVFFLLGGVFVTRGRAQQKFEKSGFYEVMSSGDMDAIDNEINRVQASSSNNKEGYEGALLMRKAGIIKGAKKKLALFKAGRIKLETAMMADSDNTEYHFLRLSIEEHSPKIVKYHSDIEKDKAIVQKNFKNLSPVVQKAILDYCKNSEVLHAEEF
jgi:hypothetical protein